MANITTVIRGKTSYAKILGEPVLDYDKTGKEWKFDLKIDKNTEKELKAIGLGDRVKRKDNYLDGEPHVTFKQREMRRDGTVNKPMEVKDILGNPWDQNKLIGNDSTVDVKFSKIDFGVGKKAGVYVKTIRVLDHVPYGDGFEPVDETDEFYQKAVEARRAAEAAAVQAAEQTGPKAFEPELDDEDLAI